MTENGSAVYSHIDTRASLFGPNSIGGRGLVITAGSDDLGLYPEYIYSATTGNSGPIIACCTIVMIPEPAADTTDD